MAKSLDGANKVNPRFYSSVIPRTVNAIPGDAVTYEAGQLGYYDANGKAAVCADDADKVNFMFANTRSAALTATSDKVHIIDPDTKVIMQVVDGTTDAAASRTMVGANYSIEIISNKAVVDLDSGAAHSNDIFHVDGLMADVEPKRHAIADEPGMVYGHFIRTATTDVNAG